MDQVVGCQLAHVLVHLLVAVRQVHDAVLGEGLGHRMRGLARCRERGVDRVVTEEVAVEPVTHVRDRAAAHQRLGPAVLAHHVVDQLAHVPLLARRRLVPLVRADGIDSVGPALDGALVQPVQFQRRHAFTVSLRDPLPPWPGRAVPTHLPPHRSDDRGPCNRVRRRKARVQPGKGLACSKPRGAVDVRPRLNRGAYT